MNQALEGINVFDKGQAVTRGHKRTLPSQGQINRAIAISRQTLPILLALSCWTYLPRKESANSWRPPFVLRKTKLV
jgi:hypothetical protein